MIGGAVELVLLGDCEGDGTAVTEMLLLGRSVGGFEAEATELSEGLSEAAAEVLVDDVGDGGLDKLAVLDCCTKGDATGEREVEEVPEGAEETEEVSDADAALETETEAL